MKKFIISLSVVLVTALTVGTAQEAEKKGKGKKGGKDKAAMFASMAGDDEVITEAEWMAAVEKRKEKAEASGKTAKGGDPKAKFAKMDKDESGDISKEEFMASKGGKGKGKKGGKSDSE